jgi:hypothetical protein
MLALTAHGVAQQLPVLGQGNIKCDSWIERRQGNAPEGAAATAWLLGYLTAYNHYQACARWHVRPKLPDLRERRGCMHSGLQLGKFGKWAM